MHSLMLVLVLFVLSTLSGCTQKSLSETGDDSVAVRLTAAFATLSHVDVYRSDGDFLRTIDSSVDFQDVLPDGIYYMDFVNEDGDHAFMEDGRLAFAPMGEGMTPLDGPFDIDDQPMWQVAVDQVLEGNARLNMRIRDGDETLRPWKDLFPGWQVNLPDEERDPIEDSEWIAQEKAYSTTTGSSSARLRVTWEASYAMSGDYSNTKGYTCTSSTKCWTRSSSTPGSTSSYYAVWDYDSNKTGYIDYDEAAWDTMTSNYKNGDASCAQSGYSLSTPCKTSSTIGVGTAKYYTCQSSSGSCTSGSSGTKPRGGQCKAFQNLVLYRSGQYNSGSWKTLPSDTTISGYSSSGSSAPTTSTSNIAVGDVLRQTTSTSLHSMIVVAYDSSSQSALVVDSNYVSPSSGSYYEYIGAHIVGFSTTTFTSVYTRLGNYRNLKCVYAGTC